MDGCHLSTTQYSSGARLCQITLDFFITALWLLDCLCQHLELFSARLSMALMKSMPLKLAVGRLVLSKASLDKIVKFRGLLFRNEDASPCK